MEKSGCCKSDCMGDMKWELRKLAIANQIALNLLSRH